MTFHLKAFVIVKEKKIVRLLERIMCTAGGQFYVEVLIDFDIVHRLFKNRAEVDRQQEHKFTTIKIEVQNDINENLDHV